MAIDDTARRQIAALTKRVVVLESAQPDASELTAERASNDFMGALLAKINGKTYVQQETMFAALKTALTPL